jgi:coenzyme F420 hydrogenase subunit beta
MMKINGVLNSGLCCGCGTCAGICPQNAIEMVIDQIRGIYVPTIDIEKCKECGLCYEVCPGHAVNFEELNRGLFGRSPCDILLGNYENCYIGYAVDDDIRFNASSGGAVTALLAFALEQGIIDGAVVTRMSKERVLEPEPFIARTKEELVEASKSKYCPVPVNVVMKDILNSKDDERFAVVGLPCHIHGIRKAQARNKKLQKKIVLCIGLICSHNNTVWQVKSLVERLDIREQDIEKIEFRGHGWPGRFAAILKNGDTVTIPYSEAMTLHNLWFNAVPRCLLCCDLTSELADISCGDPWIPEVTANETIGRSLIISRSKSSEHICQNACNTNYVDFKDISPDKVKQSSDMMRTKKRDINARFLFRRMFKREIPVYSTRLLKPNIVSYLRSLFIHFNTGISNTTYLRKLTCSLASLEKRLFSVVRRQK